MEAIGAVLFLAKSPSRFELEPIDLSLWLSSDKFPPRNRLNHSALGATLGLGVRLPSLFTPPPYPAMLRSTPACPDDRLVLANTLSRAFLSSVPPLALVPVVVDKCRRLTSRFLLFRLPRVWPREFEPATAFLPVAPPLGLDPLELDPAVAAVGLATL